MEFTYIIKKEDIEAYTNINSILKNKLFISNRLLVKLIEKKCISLNNSICDTRQKPSLGDKICINFNFAEDNSNIIPKKMNLDIIYEDEWFLVLNKPAGIAIHPSMLHFDASLSNGVKYYFDSINLEKKIRPVNRLDYNTSGLVIFAKCEYIQECFSLQMTNKEFKKTYLCIVEGNFSDKKIGYIDLPIARKPGSIIERCVDEKGQKSITHYNVLKNFDGYSLIECILETGRTHQIRVHFSSIGHPLLGDSLYGKSSELINRQALHSYKIKLIHPIKNSYLEFIAPLPSDISFILEEQ